jgi:dTDP-4-dehydrorhamnose 3,5-epimerase-like enzyme
MNKKKDQYSKLDFNTEQEGIIFENIKRFWDDRGDFTNLDFNIKDKTFKRNYIINNNKEWVVRAFHWHKKEAKLFYVPKGAFKFTIINMKTKEWKHYTLLESVPKILYIPEGYYNGFVSLNSNALLCVFSTSTIQESMDDDYRIPYDALWKEIWDIENR